LPGIHHRKVPGRTLWLPTWAPGFSWLQIHGLFIEAPYHLGPTPGIPWGANPPFWAKSRFNPRAAS
jgi:hypothetical protein